MVAQSETQEDRTGRLSALWKRWCQPTHRVLLGTVGAYFVAATSSAAVGLGLSSLFGAPKANMLLWTIMLGFFVYCAAAIWAFADVHGWRIWAGFAAIIALSAVVVGALGGDPTFGFGG
ncbi:MAG: hypothetical protein AAF683_15155 [Pseudomonadota bacterium]